MGTLRDLIRDTRSAQGARRQYQRDALRLRLLARDHFHLGHGLLGREAAYWSRIVERAAAAEER